MAASHAFAEATLYAFSAIILRFSLASRQLAASSFQPSCRSSPPG